MAAAAAAIREENKLTFQSTKLAPLAVIQSRTRLLPYQGWHIRPCAGEQGGEAILSLDVSLLLILQVPLLLNRTDEKACRAEKRAEQDLTLLFHGCVCRLALSMQSNSMSWRRASSCLAPRTPTAFPSLLALCNAGSLGRQLWHLEAEGGDAALKRFVYSPTLRPSFECFNDLLKTKFSPRALLAKLMERGMFLMPEDRDAEFAKVTRVAPIDLAAERHRAEIHTTASPRQSISLAR